MEIGKKPSLKSFKNWKTPLILFEQDMTITTDSYFEKISVLTYVVMKKIFKKNVLLLEHYNFTSDA